MFAANSASSSSYEVRMIVRIDSSRLRISRQTSIPLPSPKPGVEYGHVDAQGGDPA
jgi:hypothetical protein